MTGQFLPSGKPHTPVDYEKIRNTALAAGLVAGVTAGLLAACIPLLMQFIERHWG